MSSPIKVLIIDDTEEVLSALCKYFKQKNYEVLSASNGLDGLKMIETEKHNLDIIITDLVLPNISGVAVISIVKKKFPNLPVTITANTTVYIHRQIGSTNNPTLLRLFKGQSATVVDYRPYGSHV